MCEEFGCLPSQAAQELDEDFEGVMDVLWTRQYARAKQAYDGLADLPPEARAKVLAQPMVQLVKQVDFELAADALAKATGDG